MINKKNIIKKFFCTIAIFLILSSVCFASITNDAMGRLSPIAKTYGDAGGTKTKTIAEVVALVIQYALSFLGVIFVVLIIYAGFLWMTASGDQDKVSKSKDILTSAVIGLIIILSSYTITFFILKNLTKSMGGYN